MTDPSPSPIPIPNPNPYGFEDAYSAVVKAENPITIEGQLDDILAQFKEDDIIELQVLNNRKIFVPGIKQPSSVIPPSGIPSVSREPSLGTITVEEEHYIDDKTYNPNNIEHSKKATTTINIINEHLKSYNLFWNITYRSIYDKLYNNGKYLGNTLYGLWNLENGANLAMLKSLHEHEDSVDSNTLIIDYSNLKFGLRRCRKKIDSILADEIRDWINEEMGACDRIIISIQQNNLTETGFEELITELTKIFGEDNTIVVVGSNASTFDDLNIAYIVTKLLPNSNKYVISSDKFNDIQKLETGKYSRKYPVPIFETTDKLTKFDVEIFCVKLKRFRRGGTNKNKYTRKIKNSKKVKTLHKKRNTSKKVLKKYNKNYKKKTLRRKNK